MTPEMTSIVVALIVAIPPSVLGIVALILNRKTASAVNQVHLSINSRMDELLAAARGEATAEGRELGRAETSIRNVENGKL